MLQPFKAPLVLGGAPIFKPHRGGGGGAIAPLATTPLPQQWLAENRLSICPSCNKLVAISWLSHHKRSYLTSVNHEVTSSSTLSQASINLPTSIIHQETYPSIEEVLSCRCPTLKYIPHQHLGTVLADVLKKVIFEILS